MEINQMNWKEQDPWGLKEFISLLFLEFVVVIGCIKFVMHPLYVRWLGNELYAGTLMGLTIAITVMLGVFLIALRPKRLSWGEVGLIPFSKKDWKVIVLFSIILIIGASLLVVLTSLIGNSFENSKTDAMKQNKTWMTVFLAFISAAVISPVYEEIFYRGFLYR